MTRRGFLALFALPFVPMWWCERRVKKPGWVRLYPPDRRVIVVVGRFVAVSGPAYIMNPNNVVWADGVGNGR